MLWDGYTMRSARSGEGRSVGPRCCFDGGLVSSAVMVALTGPMSEAALEIRLARLLRRAGVFGLTTLSRWLENRW